MYSSVFKIGNGNNQYTKGNPTKDVSEVAQGIQAPTGASAWASKFAGGWHVGVEPDDWDSYDPEETTKSLEQQLNSAGFKKGKSTNGKDGSRSEWSRADGATAVLTEDSNGHGVDMYAAKSKKEGLAHVFKVGNGNNQHGRPYPTKSGHQGDGSKAHSALGVTSPKGMSGAYESGKFSNSTGEWGNFNSNSAAARAGKGFHANLTKQGFTGGNTDDRGATHYTHSDGRKATVEVRPTGGNQTTGDTGKWRASWSITAPKKAKKENRGAGWASDLGLV